MSPVRVERVRTSRQQREFIDLPWRLYHGDPNWIPPIIDNIRELCGFRPHPFYDRAECDAFVAYRGEQPVGRVLAIVNHAHNERYRERRGFFGFFESENDGEIATALFDRAREWLADRNIRKVRGPTNPSLNYECGLLIDGFDRPPVFMMTYNPPYYLKLIEDYGFTKIRDLLAYVGFRNIVCSAYERLQPVIQMASERLKCHIRHMDTKRFLAEQELFLDLYNKSMVALWGFVPLSVAELRHIAKSLQFLAVPELGIFAEADGKTVGTMLGMLDYNPRIKQIDGRLWPFGFIKLLSNRNAIKAVRVLSINVLPEYHRYGVGVLLLGEMLRLANDYDTEMCEFSWILEDNRLARRGLEKGGATVYKTYRMFDYAPMEDTSDV